MNEIEKLYENAGIEKRKFCEFDPDCIYFLSKYCELKYDIKCENYIYPPFTAEKQIKLLEFDYKYSRVPAIGYIIELKKYDCPHYDYGAFDTFQEVLCAEINYHWQFLTEQEKEQIKKILNG